MKRRAPWNLQKKRDSDREAREMGKETEREGRKHGESLRKGAKKM